MPFSRFLIVAGLGLALTAASLAAPTTGMRVTDSGVGTAVVDRELQGRSDTFDEGTQVVFLVRIEGGKQGDSIEHVWIREGDVRGRVQLAIGGSPWRTWSRVTMHPGLAGAWRVEARAPDATVLASAEFTCASAK